MIDVRTPPLLAIIWTLASCQGIEGPDSEPALSFLSDAEIEAVIPDSPTCPRCTIEVQDLLRLEDAPVAPIPTAPRSVVEDSLGRFWLVFANHLPIVYGPDGTFIRELGPRGQGPLEYEYPSLVHPLPGDSVLVHDSVRRVFYVLGPDLTQARVIRTDRTASGSVVVLDWPGTVLLNLPSPARPGTDHVFGVVDMGGPQVTLSGSFAAAGTSASPGINAFSRSLAPGADAQVWAWQPAPYRIERWRPSGDRTALLDRESSWFPSPYPHPREVLASNQPLPPQLRTAAEDEGGRLWVFVDVPRPTWREGFPEVPPGVRAIEMSEQNFFPEKVYQTTVEVIDPEEGRIITESRLDGWVISMFVGGRAAMYETTEEEIPFIRIVQLRLVQ